MSTSLPHSSHAAPISTSSHRKWIWISSLVLVAWFLIGGGMGPLFGQLSNVQKNDNSKFLPASAPSSKAADQVSAFTHGTKGVFPTFVLFQGQVTPEIAAQAQSFANTIGSKNLVDIKGNPIKDLKGKNIAAKVGDFFSPNTPPVILGGKTQALLISLPLDSTKAFAALSNKKPAITNIISTIRFYSRGFATQHSLTTVTTGLGALFSDLFGAFGGLDSSLLFVSVGILLVILLVVYRSLLLPLVTLLSAIFALAFSGGIIYLLAKHNVITLDGQSQGILDVLVLGAATDYALLLTSRYREELHHHLHRVEAMKTAWRAVVEPIVASGSTVSLGLIVLLLSQLSNNKSLGPVGAIGIISAMFTILTLLPVMLILLGRAAYWPLMPRFGAEDEKLTGIWSKIASATEKKPRRFAAITTIVLIVLAGFSTTLHANGISTVQSFTTKPESVTGQAILDKIFPAGIDQPTQVVVKQSESDQVISAIKAIPGVSSVVLASDMTGQPLVINGNVLVNATLKASPDSNQAVNVIPVLRAAVAKIDPTLSVGGTSAVYYDTHKATQRDQHIIIPIVLLLILFILSLLLRSILAGIVLLTTVILSYLATLGACAITFHHIFHFAGSDTSFPLFAFIFLVALGIDYNIFLMTRVREESIKLGTSAGVTKGVTVTGGVITSAGLVLAATFTVLGIIPIVFLAEIGFAVGFGVLLDTLVVRSLLVPALVHIIGKKIWWPSAISR